MTYMIDPMLSLAISVHSNEGLYALLLGSGISQASGIKTAWGITEDLIQKLAHIMNEECDPNPETWYINKFDKEPNYGDLLAEVRRSPTGRRQLLKGYFEPNEEEREQGLKVPTAAHKAIAKLAANGYIRVIVTTNFDHLLENALDDVDIEPAIVRTSSDVKGALPIPYERCTIIKVNGDYLDTRIRNTRDELEKYGTEMNKLLDRVFDEFGLIVCGWSAEWDTALRKAIERRKNHRFTTYWAARDEPSERARKLIRHRRAEVIRIRNADNFFSELAENVFALEKYSKTHPLSVPVLVQRIKTYLRDDRCDIRLHDLMNQEVETLYARLIDDKTFPVSGISEDEFKDEFRRQVQLYESLTEPVLAMMITGCHWGEIAHKALWINCLERIANFPKIHTKTSRSAIYNQNGKNIDITETLVNLRLYPALLLLYGGGIASVAAGKYNIFSSLVNDTRFIDKDELHPLLVDLHRLGVMKSDAQKLMSDQNNQICFCDYLFSFLRDHFSDLIYFYNDFENRFNRFEYLLILVRAKILSIHRHVTVDIRIEHELETAHFFKHWNPESGKISIIEEIESEVSREGDNWPLLKTGLFDGSLEEFQRRKEFIDYKVQKLVNDGRF